MSAQKKEVIVIALLRGVLALLRNEVSCLRFRFRTWRQFREVDRELKEAKKRLGMRDDAIGVES